MPEMTVTAESITVTSNVSVTEVMKEAEISGTLESVPEQPESIAAASEEVTEEITSITLPAESEISETDLTGAESVTNLIETENEIYTLPAEEETITSVTTEVSVNAARERPLTDMITDNGQTLVIGAALIAAAGGLMFLNKKSQKREKESSARQRDSDRINKKRAEEKAVRDKEKADGQKKKAKLPKTVEQTMPYIRCLQNDIWLLADKTYSKVYEIDDINYNLGDESQQNNILVNYCNFLNTLDDTAECQISVWNNSIDVNEYEKEVLIKEADDGFNDMRREYNEKVLRVNLSKGQNARRKRIFVTMTIKAADEVTAERRFNSIDLNIKNSFDRIGNTWLRPLTNQERVEILKDIFKGSDVKIPEFTMNDYQQGIEKTYCAPDYFEFKADYFMFGDYYAKCVFIKDYPKTISDDVISELMDTNLKLIVTSNIFSLDTAKARKLVQRQITAVDTNMAQRESKAAKAGNFSSTMPVSIKNQLDSYKQLFDMLTVEDQKLFQVNTQIMVTANDYEELTNAMELISSTLKRKGCGYSEMKWQQEDGMCDILPVGTQRKFQWKRSMPTESVGIFLPFNVKEIHQKNAVYYGCNKLSNNLITFDRIMSLINPSGFILGTSGSGKSFGAKREMVEVRLRYPNAEVIIIDPEREYPQIVDMFNGQSVKISTGSRNYINPFDFDLALLDDDDVDVIADKCQLITSFISCMYEERSLTPQEASFIDRCVRKTYRNSNFLATLDPEDMPILEDFYNIMRNETENVDEVMKRDMPATLEMYIGEGSASYFSHRTNVDIYNRLVSYDIKDLTGTLKTQAMLLVLDNIWNRLSANRNKGIATWIYIDEIHVLFSNKYCLEFIRNLYKRARKYGGVLTGITQNVEDLLRDDDCRSMLSNSEFLFLLKQSDSDAEKLRDVLHFTESELFYVKNVDKGEGLLVLGGQDKIPFYDKFPRDTKLYHSMSTSFSETQAMMAAQTENGGV